MPELKRQFGGGAMNKDLDERLVPSGQYRDALNIEVSSSEGSDIGAVQNILGNKYAYGSAISSSNLGANPTCIGVYANNKTEKIYWFVSSDTKSLILEFNQTNETVVPVLVDTTGVLNFNKNYLITGINIIDNLLFWTDDQEEPKKINIDDWRGYANGSYSHTQISSSNFVEDQVAVIKKAPIIPPSITMSATKRTGVVETTLLQKSFTQTSSPYDPIATGNYGSVTFTTAVNYEVGDKLKLTLANNNNIEEVILSITTKTSSTIYTVSADVISNDIEEGNQDWKVVLIEEKPIFEFKFPKFAFRYKYKDNEYSSIGPYSEVAFLPSDFDYNTKKGYNKGMINTVRSLKVGGFAASAPNGVVEIDILYKESSNNNIYTVQTIKSTDPEYTAGTNGEVEITSDVIYKVLPSLQGLRPYDNVPRKAKAQALSANRIMYGNYLENFDIKDSGNNEISVKFEVAIVQNPSVPTIIREPKPSIKSLRTYQLGVVYRDAFGRETPVFTDPSGSFTLDKLAAINYNVLKVNITSSIPYWAESYKFFIKESSDEYYNLAMDRHYPAEDGNVWIAFPSSERNKVSEETFVVLKKRHNDDTFVSDDARYKIISISNEAPDFLKLSKVPKGYLNPINAGASNENVFLADGFPLKDRTYVYVTKAKYEKVFGGKDSTSTTAEVPVHQLSNLCLRILGSGSKSNYHDIASIKLFDTSTDYYIITIEDKFEEDEIAFTGTYSSSDTTLALEIYQKQTKTEPEFQGRFFAKIERDGILEDAILNKENSDNYSVIANTYIYALTDKNATKDYWRDTSKGVYPGNGGSGDTKHAEWFLCKNTFRHYKHAGGGMTTNGNKYRGRLSSEALAHSTKGFGAEAGNDYMEIAFHWWGGNDRNAWQSFWTNFESKYQTQFKSIVNALQTINQPFRFTGDTDSERTYKIKSYARSNIGAYKDGKIGRFGSMRVIKWTLQLDKELVWVPEDNNHNSKATATQIEFLDVYAGGDEKGSTSDNPAIFETEPKEIVDLNLYYEASKAYNKSTHGIQQTLDYSNCFSFANGVESDRIRDDFNAPKIGKGVKASTVLDIPYKEEKKSNQIIFSGIYNSISGVNDTNQFIQADQITKSLNPQYGSIQLMRHRQSGLDVLCEDKCFKIPTNKDILFTADGNKQVSVSSKVLGAANPYVGDYGISKNPESYTQFGFRAYFTDKARGAVLRLSGNGLEEISRYGMDDYFKDNLKSATTAIGSYDVTKGEYNLTLNFDTISFKESINAWSSRKSFLQEDGVSLNNIYYTLKDGQLWSHNNETRNNFYNTQYNSTIKFIFNDAPGSVKSFNTLNYEGSQARIFVDNDTNGDGVSNSDTDNDFYNRLAVQGWWANSLSSDLQEGQVLGFEDKEGKWFNFIQGTQTSSTNLDTKEFSVQGIGTATNSNISASGYSETVTITINENAD